MLGFAESFIAWSAVTVAPALFGLLAITWAGKRMSGRYVAAFALGIFFWFFVDTILGASTLDVNSGFAGGAPQVALVALFFIGLLFFFWIDRNRYTFSPQSAVGKYGLTIPFVVAVSVGIHGLGEGAAFGGTAYLTASTSLLNALGGVGAGVAYLLHKGLEPMMIGACYSVYLKGEDRMGTRWLTDVMLLTLVFAIPSILGAATGYFFVYEATYFFALGTGTSIYAGIRLVGPLFGNGQASAPWMTTKIALSLAIGFMSIYFAALFHS